MKLDKHNIYIDLRGKGKEELTDIKNVLTAFNEPTFRENLISYYYENQNDYNYFHFNHGKWLAYSSFDLVKNKQEVTIQQLKEILQPMGTFRPIAMKCTQEQFEAIKPKLNEIGKICELLSAFTKYEYLTNNYEGKLTFDFVKKGNNWFEEHKGNIHEEWNKEVFLKACGIEVETTLTEQLEKAEAEVNRLKEAIEESKIKVGDWVKRNYNGIQLFKADDTYDYRYINSEKRVYQKITDQDLINKLNELIK